MPPSAVDELFADYAAALARGERPRAADYLDRAGAEADALATMIERFLQAVPRPAATAEDSALLAAWLQHEPPLLELRRRQGLKRAAVVDSLLGRLGLASSSRSRLADAYHELETGQLDPAGVDQTVWSALTEILKANVRELAAWRPPPLAASPAFRAAPDVSLESHVPYAPLSGAGGRRGRPPLSRPRLTGGKGYLGQVRRSARACAPRALHGDLRRRRAARARSSRSPKTCSASPSKRASSR